MTSSRSNHWGNDPAKLSIGIEQEHFIAKDGRAPTLSEMANVFQSLVTQGYRPARSAKGLLAQVNTDVPGGYIAIKNDCSTGIIEVAFPPFRDPLPLKELYERTWGHIRDSLTMHGMTIIHGGRLHPPLPGLHLLDFPGMEWLTTRPMPPSNSAFQTRYYTATICSTQMHFNILDDSLCSMLPRLYAFEYLIPLLYSNSPATHPTPAHCARPLVYRDSLPAEYRTVCVPASIPDSKAAYEERMAESGDIDRDFSFVLPRPEIGTVEFRSACSQDQVDAILEIVALRISILLAAMATCPIEDRNARDLFFQVCEGDLPRRKLVENDIAILCAHEKSLPEQWQPYFAQFLKRVAASAFTKV